MAEEEEGRSLDGDEGLVGGAAELGPAADLADEGVGEDLGDARGGVLAGPRVENEDAEVRVVLLAQGREDGLQRVPRCADDDDGHHGRRLGVGVHRRLRG